MRTDNETSKRINKQTYIYIDTCCDKIYSTQSRRMPLRFPEKHIGVFKDTLKNIAAIFVKGKTGKDKIVFKKYDIFIQWNNTDWRSQYYSSNMDSFLKNNVKSQTQKYTWYDFIAKFLKQIKLVSGFSGVKSENQVSEKKKEGSYEAVWRSLLWYRQAFNIYLPEKRWCGYAHLWKYIKPMICLASLVAQMVKNEPATQETWVQSLIRKIPWRRKW